MLLLSITGFIDDHHRFALVLLFLLLALESFGLPLPGETALIACAVLASQGTLSIAAVIVVAIAAAIIGDNCGYWVARRGGRSILFRYRITRGAAEKYLPFGERFFAKHGGKAVFFGRFVAVLRTIAALLAGAHRMEWRRFLAANAAGGLAWVTLYGFVAYQLGHEVKRLARPAALVVGAIAVVAIVAGLVLIRRHAAELEDAAERAIPGPLRPPGRSAD